MFREVMSMLLKIGRFLYNHWKKILIPSLLMLIGLVLCATGVLAPIGILAIAASIAIPIGVTLGSLSLLTLALKISPPRSIKFPPVELVYSSNENRSWFDSVSPYATLSQEKITRREYAAASSSSPQRPAYSDSSLNYPYRPSAPPKGKQKVAPLLNPLGTESAPSSNVSTGQTTGATKKDSQRDRPAPLSTPQRSSTPVYTAPSSSKPPQQTVEKDPKESEWRKFLVSMLRCLKKDRSGNITGIDTENRRELIRQTLMANEELFRFPDYMKKSNAGNIVITTKHLNTSSQSVGEEELKRAQGHTETVKNLIDNVKVVQSIRYDNDGNLNGRGLYGGLAGSGMNRYDVAVVNTGEKLALATTKPIDKSQMVDKVRLYAAGNLKQIAYSIHDVGYLINSFLPKREFLESLNNSREIDEETYAYYKQLLDNANNSLNHLLHDPDSLKLATSNTYLLDLDINSSKNLLDNLTDTKVSDPYKFVKYQLEYRPLLSCLYPQDYLYRHEFYCGIMPTLRCSLYNNFELTITCLKQATGNIIARIKQDIEKGVLPNQIQGLQANEAFEIWKSLTEINFQKFVRQYPGIHWDSITNILQMDFASFMTIDPQLQDIWGSQRDEIIRLIANRLENQNTDYRSDLISGTPTGHHKFTKNSAEYNNQEQVKVLKQQAISNLFESPIAYERYTAPLIAFDCYIYDQSEYVDINASNGLSPFTRASFLDKPSFPYKALAEFIAAYTTGAGNKKMAKLLALSKDTITGAIMSNPVIAMIEDSRTTPASYQALVCDQSTLNTLPDDLKISSRRDFSELRDVIQWERPELERLLSLNPTTTTSWATLFPEPSIPELMTRGVIQPLPYTAASTRHWDSSSSSSAAFRPPQHYSHGTGYQTNIANYLNLLPVNEGTSNPPPRQSFSGGG
jgi:hypothetical protein